MEDVTQYFMLQLIEDTSAPLTEETYSKLPNHCKAELSVGDIPVTYLKMTGNVASLQLTSLTKALVEVNDKKFIKMSDIIPAFDFEG